MLKLNQEYQKTILAKNLKDGQLAVITDDVSNYKGRIVQKHGNNLVAIGMATGNGWSNANSVTLSVRILEDGELLTVTNNE